MKRVRINKIVLLCIFLFGILICFNKNYATNNKISIEVYDIDISNLRETCDFKFYLNGNIVKDFTWEEEVEQGSNITIECIVPENYEFVGWYDIEQLKQQSTDLSYSFTADKNIALFAYIQRKDGAHHDFKINPYVIDFGTIKAGNETDFRSFTIKNNGTTVIKDLSLDFNEEKCTIEKFDELNNCWTENLEIEILNPGDEVVYKCKLNKDAYSIYSYVQEDVISFNGRMEYDETSTYLAEYLYYYVYVNKSGNPDLTTSFYIGLNEIESIPKIGEKMPDYSPYKVEGPNYRKEFELTDNTGWYKFNEATQEFEKYNKENTEKGIYKYYIELKTPRKVYEDKWKIRGKTTAYHYSSEDWIFSNDKYSSSTDETIIGGAVTPFAIFEPIKEIDVKIEKPNIGENAGEITIKNSSEKYTILDTFWAKEKYRVYTSNFSEKYTGVFEKDNYYYAHFIIEANELYAINENTVFKVNGEDVEDVIILQRIQSGYADGKPCNKQVSIIAKFKPKDPNQTFVLGDINEDGKINADDAANSIEIFKTNNQTDENIAKGDMDGNGRVTAEDAALIIEYFKTHN